MADANLASLGHCHMMFTYRKQGIATLQHAGVDRQLLA